MKGGLQTIPPKKTLGSSKFPKKNTENYCRSFLCEM